MVLTRNQYSFSGIDRKNTESGMTGKKDTTIAEINDGNGGGLKSLTTGNLSIHNICTAPYKHKDHQKAED